MAAECPRVPTRILALGAFPLPDMEVLSLPDMEELARMEAGLPLTFCMSLMRA